jgi:plastocyanin
MTVTLANGSRTATRWVFLGAAGLHPAQHKSGPKGVRKFRSEAAATDYTFKRKLTVPGTYRIVCTLHEEMRMTVRVRK